MNIETLEAQIIKVSSSKYYFPLDEGKRKDGNIKFF